MCFTSTTIEKRKVPKPMKAKENILVYKSLSWSGSSPYFPMYINHVCEKYTPGFIYEETTPFKGATVISTNFMVRGNAFHVNKRKAYAEQVHGGDIQAMIIPKGALYYENKDEFVTSKLWYPTKEQLTEVRKELRNKKMGKVAKK